ncbi:MAG: hypothetical protein OQK46_00690 [Gammaproteobacteria bacterium]|nr:hypothetical protein [Gammaproteobacteria bacterium]
MITKKILYLIKLYFLSAFSVGLLACSETVEYEIKDSGMQANNGSIDGSIAWLDNNRIIFIDRVNKDKKIFVWDVNNNNITKYSDSIHSDICYADGYITYRSRVEGDLIYYKKGLFPNEKEYLVQDDWNELVMDKYSCMWRKKPLGVEGYHIRYLKENHGYLNYGKKKTGEYYKPTTYVKSNKEEMILPTTTIVWKSTKGYFPFKDAYFFWGAATVGLNWDYGHCKNAWWMHSNGKVEATCLEAFSEIKSAGVDVMPVLNGYLYAYVKGIRKSGAKKSGMFFVSHDGEIKEKLITGFVNMFSISPNGCKVAFTHTQSNFKNRTLKSTNLCNYNGDIK